jgi:signal transduction histidine kinase
MLETLTPEPVAAWFSLRLQDARDELTAQWLAAFSAREPYITDLIGAIAEYLCRPLGAHLVEDPAVMHQAAQLGVLRFAQGGSVLQLMREYQALADLLEEFLLDQVRRADVMFAADDVGRTMRSVTHSVRVLQQQSVEAFVQQYTDTIQRQSEQLIAFGRLVGHEMRQPLGVLQLMAGVVPIREGDHELTHLLDLFDRNIRRLTDVAGRLERLSHARLDAAVVTTDQAVHLDELVAAAIEKLRDSAHAHNVQVHIDARLPVLRVDRAQTELIFASLIANAIKYSDPEKPARLVEVRNLVDRIQPTVMVRDNGIGIPHRRAQHLFRELGRAHAHRDRGLKDSGLGRGLSIVRDAMDACGGAVLLHSIEGVGTTVTLTWPARTIPAVR